MDQNNLKKMKIDSVYKMTIRPLIVFLSSAFIILGIFLISQGIDIFDYSNIGNQVIITAFLTVSFLVIGVEYLKLSL
jgi:hypothetical protein